MLTIMSKNLFPLRNPFLGCSYTSAYKKVSKENTFKVVPRKNNTVLPGTDNTEASSSRTDKTY